MGVFVRPYLDRTAIKKRKKFSMAKNRCGALKVEALTFVLSVRSINVEVYIKDLVLELLGPKRKLLGLGTDF